MWNVTYMIYICRTKSHTMKTQITLESLAQALNGKLWIKGDMKRIYLDRGYNTKKMSTKTYVYQREDGTFGISCYIDCPSQSFAWIKSQQEEIIDLIIAEIKEFESELNEVSNANN